MKVKLINETVTWLNSNTSVADRPRGLIGCSVITARETSGAETNG